MDTPAYKHKLPRYQESLAGGTMEKITKWEARKRIRRATEHFNRKI